MNKKNQLTVVSLLAACLLTGCSHTVIKDVHLFDVRSGTMLANRTILIKEDRIVSIGTPDAPIRMPMLSKTIEGEGRYVIPGLIDAHSHLIFVLDSVGINGEDALHFYLANGVTSVRDIGDETIGQKRLVDYADKHPDISPSVFMCSPLIDGRHPYHGDDPVSIPITNPAQVPSFIDSLVNYGVTTVKMYVYADSAVYRKVVEEAHKRGLVVSAHLPSNAVSTQYALDLGIDVIEHAFGAPEDSAMIAQMVRQGTMFDPTLIVFRNMLYYYDQPEVWQNKDNDFMPDTLRHLWDIYRLNDGPNNGQPFAWRKNMMEKYKMLTGRLHRAGVTILAGTDSPEPYCPPGFALHEELGLLVESGLTPAEALKCATMNNAQALKQSSNLGSIEAGKLADMVILNANPLEDIRNTRTIHRVVHRGVVCDPRSILPALANRENITSKAHSNP